ncbi:hypothetical protein VP1G_02138 [Cytospora mali]|uniref:Uncharacterized protein n=1 Tax=Cytospora mali TaxID=578113 RepID=A0A194USU1_CYTMA|nr:hypothetical protein VP1G_02138 [Valsa mali var. pyri (nom. inval.)]
MDPVPFSVDDELCKSLRIQTVDRSASINTVPKPARNCHDGRTATEQQKDYLPGEPRILLNNTTIGGHLERELTTKDLDTLSPYVWLLTKQDSSHISPLTHQIVRRREIVITERPELHLVWYYNRVFIKPLPKYLLSRAFWDFYLLSSCSPIQEPLRSDLRKAALGFLRSYALLVRHQSDFDLAVDRDHRFLLRKIKYPSFVRLARSLEATVTDSMVSPLYQCGELRLSRLNFWSKVFLRRFTYHKVEGQYTAYFGHFYGPILFVFAVLSVPLDAMQVALAVQPPIVSNTAWIAFARMSWGFSIFTLFIVVILVSFLLMAFVGLASREIVYASQDLYRRSGRTNT